MVLWKDLQQQQVTPPNRRGKGQGYFRYYRPDGSFKAIVAVDGKLMLDGGDLPITGLPEGFQEERMIEAVQWKDKLFIATGTELVEYDGTLAKVVEPYRPKPLEALEIGTNGLMDFPDNYLDDGEGDLLSIMGVMPDKRIGIPNQPTTFSTFISKVAGTNIEYKYEYGMKRWAAGTGAENLLLGKDWSDSKTWMFTPSQSGDWTIKVSARVKATPEFPTPGEPEAFTIPTYKVTSTDENIKIDTNWVKTCNRIMLYWDRLIMYGDTTKKSQIYISHLQNPRYFPVNNTLEFENTEQEGISKLVPYRDFILIFMPTSVQALLGKSPTGSDPFSRYVVHTGVGCIAPETAKVMGNDVVFLSKEGIMVLRSFGLNENRMNIEQLDGKIRNIIPSDTNACAIFYDHQYHICFPNRKQRLRFYTNHSAWTMDESPYFDFAKMYEWQSELVVQSQDTGQVFQFDENVFNDLGFIYEDRILTKSFDMSAPYNPKKFKELHVITERNEHDTKLVVTVNVDNNAVVNPIKNVVSVNDRGEVESIEVLEPNIIVDSGTVLGSWDLGVFSFSKAKSEKSALPISGKGRLVSIDIRHKLDVPNTLLGVAFVYKLKKP
ncbi:MULTISPECIES: hypothetical protein [unclassified Peribacillus]|uniref:hypothetical protein n=1 Tax=unclassified Peribacillus TaxID=2675266 RepID=UPI00366B781C